MSEQENQTDRDPLGPPQDHPRDYSLNMIRLDLLSLNWTVARASAFDQIGVSAGMGCVPGQVGCSCSPGRIEKTKGAVVPPKGGALLDSASC